MAVPVAVELGEAPSNGPSAAYLATAKKIGLRSLPILEWELDAVLRDEHIRVYEYAKVEAYLNDQVKNLSTKNNGVPYGWVWKPLRDADVVHELTMPRLEARVYSQAIPADALMVIADTIEKVTAHVPEAKFYVTEVRAFPDPFAGVTVPGSKTMRVFERWNEPGFRS